MKKSASDHAEKVKMLYSRKQHMLDQAISFYIAASRCNQPVNVTPSVSQVTIIPAIVCYAFCCEVYLKLLAVIDKKHAQLDNHQLHLIFKSLDKRTIKQICDLWEQHKTTYGDIDTCLSRVSNYFSNYRYVYENLEPRDIGHQHLKILAEILHKTARIVAPELLVIGENANFYPGI